MTDAKPSKRTLRAPPGTRDFYPADLLRRRYIEKAWRDTAIRHGFEEIDGPTFETADLYKVKSGEGILGEMFGVFSGKAEEDLKQLRETGEAPFALRPEFTPTLARMYAARAAQLPKPCKWFWQQTCFRAERQQRGRLREFMQWNCDILGTENESEAQARADGELVACCCQSLGLLGLSPHEVRADLNHRNITAQLLVFGGVSTTDLDRAMSLIDRVDRLSPEAAAIAAREIGLDLARYNERINALLPAARLFYPTPVRASSHGFEFDFDIKPLVRLAEAAHTQGISPWCKISGKVVRGLAYYTGMVFEVLAEGERAIAGGGRYDNLIELFGGQPTPAVGFGMGDVVLSLLLTDKGLMPDGKDLLDALSRPTVCLRPEAFVISNGKEESDAAMRPLVARLRCGVESEAWRSRDGRKPWDADRYSAPPLHARHSYKATKNIGKLLQEASACHARFAAIIESAEHATLKNLDTRHEEKNVPLDSLAARIHSGMGPARA